MTRTRRIIKWTAITVASALVLAVALAAIALFTTPGARLVLGIAGKRGLPLSARVIEGGLANRFVFVDVELAVANVQATVDTLMVVWHPFALRRRLIAVDDVTVAGAHIHIVEDADTVAAPPEAKQAGKEAKRWLMDASRVRVRRSSLAVAGLSFRDVDVIASGGWTSYRADVRATTSLPRIGPVQAFVRAKGGVNAVTADSLEVQLLGGRAHGSAFVRWKDGVAWHARIEGTELHPGQMADAPAEFLGAVALRANTRGLVHGDTTQVRAEILSLDGMLRERPLSTRGLVQIDGARIVASDARVQWGSAHATLSGSMADSADVTLDAVIPSLAELLPRARGSASVRGRITGSPESIDVDVSATGRNVRAARFDVPAFDAAVRATLSAENYVPHGAHLHRLDASISGGRLHADGTVLWRDGIQWNGRVATERVETSLLTPAKWKIRGPISVRAESEGEKRGRTLRGTAAIDSLAGTIRDLPLRGAGAVAMEHGRARLSHVEIEWGRSHARIDGIIGDSLAVDFDVAAPSLAAFDSSLSGAVSAAGSARGPRRRPVVDAQLSADSLRIGQYAALAVRGTVDADASLQSPAEIDLVALGVARGETTFDTLSVQVSGPRESHRASLHAATPSLSATIALRGAYADSAWSGWIDGVRIQHQQVGTWRLQHPAPVKLSKTAARVDSLVLASGAARLAARGEWQSGRVARADVDVRDLEMERLQHYLAPGVTVSGTANGKFALDARGKRVRVQADVQTGPGEISFAERKLAYAGSLTGAADSTGVHAQADIALRDGRTDVATVTARLGIDGFVVGRDSLGAQPIDGAVDLECADIGTVLAVVAPTVGKSSGRLSAHAQPKGTAGDFRIVGTMSLENARADLRNGLRLRDVTISLVSQDDGSLKVDGRVTSGGGRVNLGARTTTSEQGVLGGVITAKGERFQVINQPDAQVFISPNVEVRIAERRAHITGDVRVPFARIETTQVPASAAAPSNDVVFVEDTLATSPKFEVQTQLQVTLGDSVTFKGFGLDARLGGSLAIDDASGRPTHGTGEIQIVDGRYRAFGSELKIDTGRLVFGGGPVDNPGLDIRAVRGLTTQSEMASSGEYVGIHLRGTLRKPDFSVFSNPPMSESEIMSYLVLGRGASSAGSEQSALASAAMLIGMQKGTSLAGEIGGKLSLDEAYLESGSELKEASFVAGKYLSPKLYVSYATGLFEHTNTFRARYSLGKRWTLQSENGEANSADLMYWFERGK